MALIPRWSVCYCEWRLGPPSGPSRKKPQSLPLTSGLRPRFSISCSMPSWSPPGLFASPVHRFRYSIKQKLSIFVRQSGLLPPGKTTVDNRQQGVLCRTWTVAVVLMEEIWSADERSRREARLLPYAEITGRLTGIRRISDRANELRLSEIRQNR